MLRYQKRNERQIPYFLRYFADFNAPYRLRNFGELATARHNSAEIAKIRVFLGRQATDVTMNVNGVWGDDAESLQMGL
jgi:hypothetical protein